MTVSRRIYKSRTASDAAALAFWMMKFQPDGNGCRIAYGTLRHNGTKRTGREQVYRAQFGNIPDGYVVTTVCGYAKCIEPSHLTLHFPKTVLLSNRNAIVDAITAERLESEIHPEPNSGCWLWGGHVGKDGYGYTDASGKKWKMHRLVYLMEVGPVATGLHLDHLCRNRACCNPDHLEPVTPRENSVRGANKLPDFAPCRKCGSTRIYYSPRGNRPSGSRTCLDCSAKRIAAWKKRTGWKRKPAQRKSA